ncbi:hypothetical protein ACQPVP_09215 [Clostridium nigeriense]
MSIYILYWIKEDFEQQGKKLEDCKFIEIKYFLEEYNNKYNK